ncbi:hypothetical protein K6327_004471, partial [Vibrio vulnificus]|nr:hypothetical protein [Vibrio vulnificus]
RVLKYSTNWSVISLLLITSLKLHLQINKTNNNKRQHIKRKKKKKTLQLKIKPANHKKNTQEQLKSQTAIHKNIDSAPYIITTIRRGLPMAVPK